MVRPREQPDQPGGDASVGRERRCWAAGSIWSIPALGCIQGSAWVPWQIGTGRSAVADRSGDIVRLVATASLWMASVSAQAVRCEGGKGGPGSTDGANHLPLEGVVWRSLLDRRSHRNLQSGNDCDRQPCGGFPALIHLCRDARSPRRDISFGQPTGRDRRPGVDRNGLLRGPGCADRHCEHCRRPEHSASRCARCCHSRGHSGRREGAETAAEAGSLTYAWAPELLQTDKCVHRRRRHGATSVCHCAFRRNNPTSGASIRLQLPLQLFRSLPQKARVARRMTRPCS